MTAARTEFSLVMPICALSRGGTTMDMLLDTSSSDAAALDMIFCQARIALHRTARADARRDAGSRPRRDRADLIARTS
jgi:hypothetical protein